MKRALLIAGGTVGGLGAVLSITPPQLGAHSSLGGGLLNTAGAATTTTPIASTTTTQPSNTSAANTPTATTPTASTPKAVVKKKHKTTKRKVAAGTTSTKSSSSSSTTVATTPTPTQATPTPAKSNPAASTPTQVSKKVTGTFVGTSVNVNYGNVQVQITVSNGRITDAQALQAPQGGRSGSISSQAIPMLRQETLTAQSSAIQGVGGASYTSYGWYTSLQSALTKAGLPL